MTRADPAISVRGRVEGLDGVRAVANLTVVLVHLHLLNQSGWIAMQAFFLLSGFLITRVLLDLKQRHDRGRYFAEFYAFRVFRILPAYYCYLLLLALGAWLVAPEFFGQLDDQLPYLFGFLFNYAWIWEDALKSPWVGHLWSLSVEEQFYLLWPVLIWVVPLHKLPKLMLTMALLGPAVRFVTYLVLAPYAERAGGTGAAAVYIAMPTYLDAFALGGLLCFDDMRRRLSAVSSRQFVCAVGIAVAAGLTWNGAVNGWSSLHWATLGYPITMPAKGQFLWGYSVTGILLTIALAKVIDTTFGHGLFRIPVLERVGQVTYSLYVIHHGLVLVLAGTTPWIATTLGVGESIARWLWLPAYFGLLYGTAFVSYTWIEQPAMRFRRRLFPSAPLRQDSAPHVEAGR